MVKQSFLNDINTINIITLIVTNHRSLSIKGSQAAKHDECVFSILNKGIDEFGSSHGRHIAPLKGGIHGDTIVHHGASTVKRGEGGNSPTVDVYRNTPFSTDTIFSKTDPTDKVFGNVLQNCRFIDSPKDQLPSDARKADCPTTRGNGLNRGFFKLSVVASCGYPASKSKMTQDKQGL